MAGPTDSSFYVIGGTLRHDAACYVERQADKDLLDGLLKGEFCYVLTSRQMGKSSLMVRTAGKLREQGVQVVVLDLTAIGQNLTPEQWYDGLLVRLGRQLDLEDELEAFWAAHRQLGPCQRMFSALRDVVLGSALVPGAVSGVPPDTSAGDEPRTSTQNPSKVPPGGTPGGATGTVALPKRLVLFVDELDVVRSLPFSTDEFFAAIRECYNRRTEDAEFNRLTFCLLGVATPSDLIRDTRTTPFNIGRRIVLNDFSPAESAPLANGLRSDHSQLSTSNSQLFLDRILYWTHGHPYLTQRLCQAVAERGRRPPAGPPPEGPPSEGRVPRGPNQPGTGESVPGEDWGLAELVLPNELVDTLGEELFFSPGAREQDDNLLFVRERLLRSDGDLATLLHFYEQVVAGKQVPDDETNPLVSVLRLSGVVRSQAGQLVERNRIYERVFDRQWIRANRPDAELRRQQRAFWRGVVKTSGVAAVILAIVTALALYANRQNRQARRAQASEAQLRQRADRQARLARARAYASDMNVAQQALEISNIRRAKDLLDRHRPQVEEEDLRGWEWRYLWQRCQSDATFTLGREQDHLICLSASADGMILATITDGLDGVSLWDLTTRQKTGRVLPDFLAARAAFSPQGGLLAVAGFATNSESAVVLFDWQQHRMVRTLPLNENAECADLSFSADGTRLVTATFFDKGRITVWRTADGAKLASYPAWVDMGTVVHPVAISRDASLVAYGTVGGMIRVIETATGDERWTAKGADEGVTSLAFSSDAKRLASGTGYAETTIRLWDVATGTELGRLVGHRGYIHDLKFLPGNEKLLSAGADQTIRLWDVPRREHLGTLVGHLSEVTELALLPGGRTLVSEDAHTLLLWDTAAARLKETFTLVPATVLAWRFTPDSQALLTVDLDRRVARWSGLGFSERHEVLKAESDWQAFHLSADGRRLAAGADDGRVRAWDLETGGVLHEIKAHSGDARPLAFMTGTNLLVTKNANGQTVKVWDLSTGRQIKSWNMDDDTRSISLSQDGRVALTLREDGTATIRDILTGQATSRQINAKPDYGGYFSRDGKLFAAEKRSRQIQIWAAPALTDVASIQGHLLGIHSMDFSPDAKRFATGSVGREAVMLWDIESQQELLTLAGQGSLFNPTAFSPDGNLLASRSAAGQLHVWRAPSWAEIEAAELKQRSSPVSK